MTLVISGKNVKTRNYLNSAKFLYEGNNTTHKNRPELQPQTYMNPTEREETMLILNTE